MTALKLYSTLFLAICFFTCKTEKKREETSVFTFEIKSLTADTVITTAVYFGRYIFCLKADHHMFVVDTLFQKINSLSDKFSNIEVDFLLSYNDTILIGSKKDIFFLDGDITLKKYDRQPIKYQLPTYTDDTYYAYACSAGEWGGAVFFWNKKSNKTYSYPATCVQQVFKFGDTYIVSNYLAHLNGLSDYLFIKDPTKLYELKDEKQKTFCNWYTLVDSIKDTKLFDTNTPPGVKYYRDTFITRTLTTFPYNNELYSIYCTDSATVLAKFQKSKLITVDTLLRRQLTFHSATTHLTNNRVLTAYEATGAIGGPGNSWTPYQNTGLIYIQGNKIKIIEFKTPHMWTNNSP